jgi:hypothetical protein
MLQVYVLNVSVVLNVHCKCIYLDVALAIHVCCQCMFQMFPLFKMYVTSVLSGCRICCSAYTHVASIYCKCFIYFRRMLQQMLYVASVLSVDAARGCRQRMSPRAQQSLRRARSQGGAIAVTKHKAAWSMKLHPCSARLLSLSPYSSWMRPVSSNITRQ